MLKSDQILGLKSGQLSPNSGLFLLKSGQILPNANGTLNLIGVAMEGITRQQRNLSMEMLYVWCSRQHDLSKSAP